MTDDLQDQLVSVVIPTWNREYLISDTLDSVYKQLYRPLELIVVDDGSVDQTEIRVKQWLDKHKQDSLFGGRYIKQKNQGGNVARNRGVKEAKGEFIAFLDSDDMWYPDKIKKQHEIFMNYSQCVGVYCGLQHFTKNPLPSEKAIKRKYSNGNILNEMLIKDITAPTSAWMVRKEVFNRAGLFDESLQARQDWDMWIRLAAEGEIRAVEEPLVYYREHEGERTASNPQKEIDAFQAIRNKYAQWLAELPLKYRKKADAAYYKRMGRIHFHHRISYGKALKYYLKALSRAPWDFDNWAALIGMFLPKKIRDVVHKAWNNILGKSPLAIRSH